MTALGGTIPALVTHFDQDGRVDNGAMRDHVDWLRERGIETVSALGSTGEGTSLSLQERRLVIEELAPQVGLVAGTGCTSLPETIELSRAAVEAGAALLVAPPSYYEPAERGVLEYFVQLFEALPAEARILLYHIPRFTEVPITTELLDELRTRFGPMLAGVKDSGGDLEHTIEWVRTFPDLAILNGSDATAEAHYLEGGAGTITMLANVLPDALERIRGGRGDGTQTSLVAVRRLVAEYPEIAAVKHLVGVVAGVPAGRVRPPLANLDDAQARTLDSRFAELQA